MLLEDYFDFLAEDDIRLKNTRIGIESILYDYIYREQTPEAIKQRFPSLSLEQIYAAILYYLSHKTVIEDYIADWLQWGQQAREIQALNPPPVVIRLKERKSQQAQTAS